MNTKREWKPIREFEDILFDEFEGIARITINRPRYRNAFTPHHLAGNQRSLENLQGTSIHRRGRSYRSR